MPAFHQNQLYYIEFQLLKQFHYFLFFCQKLRYYQQIQLRFVYLYQFFFLRLKTAVIFLKLNTIVQITYHLVNQFLLFPFFIYVFLVIFLIIFLGLFILLNKLLKLQNTQIGLVFVILNTVFLTVTQKKNQYFL